MHRAAIGAMPVAFLLLASGLLAQPNPEPVDRLGTFPFPTNLVSASTGQRIAWAPKQLTAFTDDDGQDLTRLAFTPSGEHLVFVRSGHHGGNWPSPGGIEPNPASSPTRTRVELWTVPWTGGGGRAITQGDEPAISPRGDRVAPSIDGLPIHLQVFRRGDLGPGKHPAVVYVHGGPPRQMLLGYHYWHYSASDYALNQYLASQGFVVVSVNFRLGIGYGDRFMNPDRAGSSGASEYQDVQAAAHYLRSRGDVDPARVGIYGGS
jgi:hypothetical protein